MKNEDYIDILKQALISPYGVTVRYRDKRLSRYVRQILYRVREKLRKRGCHNYDGLSILLTPDGSLQIVKRKATKKYEDELEKPRLEYLQKHELPNFIASRGRGSA